MYYGYYRLETINWKCFAMSAQDSIDTLRFLDEEQVRSLASHYTTPLYVYSKAKLHEQVEHAKRFTAPFGITIRYAMKANPHPDILKQFHDEGLLIDASSGYEAEAALACGIPGSDIMLTSQELPKNLAELLQKGVHFTACSLHQLEEYGKVAPGTKVAVRINPGIGSGENKKVTTSGLSASFGIWYEQLDRVKQLADEYSLTINQLHTHIGVGTDPAEWVGVAHANLDLVDKLPDVTSMSLGGGFKVGRMSHEPSADMAKISQPVYALLEQYAKTSGRELKLEIEPGTFMVANTGTLVTTIVDIKDTGPDGYNFIIVNAGMGEIIRPTMYGAQHPIIVVPKHDQPGSSAETEYVVCGHCCESSDVLTVAHGAPTEIDPRLLRTASIGDYLCIEGVGAYCASMSTKGYNSFPVAQEVFVD